MVDALQGGVLIAVRKHLACKVRNGGSADAGKEHRGALAKTRSTYKVDRTV